MWWFPSFLFFLFLPFSLSGVSVVVYFGGEIRQLSDYHI